MVTTELGACEWFVWDLRRSNLIDRGQLDQVIGEYLQKNPAAEPKALADYLITKGILTDFQAERLLQGKTQGFVLGPFTLMETLGTGSMGTVYKAQSKTDNKFYAVKVLPRRSMWNVRIARRKVRAFEQCQHPSVVPFVDVGTSGGMHYLAWPFVEGETLEKAVQEKGPLSPGAAAKMGLAIAEALEICHKEGLIHGILKPSNIMLGADRSIFILDFGIGCLLAETEGESLVDTMSTANAISSGLDCASPESILDPTNLTPAGDQYSLGCILYFALSGHYPFPDGSAAEKMMAHQFKEPKPLKDWNSALPSELVAVVERLMQKAPEKRFDKAVELKEALKPLARDEGPVRATIQKAQARPTLPPRRTAPPEMPKTDPVRPAASKSVPPSAPTPAPKSMNKLPVRETLRVDSTKTAVKKPAPPAVPEVLPEEPLFEDAKTKTDSSNPKERFIPGAVPENYQFTSGLEDRLGPLGIAITAMLACFLVWLVAMYFQMF